MPPQVLGALRTLRIGSGGPVWNTDFIITCTEVITKPKNSCSGIGLGKTYKFQPPALTSTLWPGHVHWIPLVPYISSPLVFTMHQLADYNKWKGSFHLHAHSDALALLCWENPVFWAVTTLEPVLTLNRLSWERPSQSAIRRCYKRPLDVPSECGLFYPYSFISYCM